MNTLTVATINILGDLAAWDQRRELLAAGLAQLHPDLLALQEVRLDQRAAVWLAERLDMPYIHQTPTTGENRDQEGLAILSRLPFQRELALNLRTQGRVAQAVQVQVDGQAGDKSSDKTLLFANTHLFWQPGASIERLHQVERLLEWIAKERGPSSAVIAGDFNGVPTCPSIERMYQEYQSAYAVAHGQEPAYTVPTPLKRSPLVLLKTGLQFIRYIRLRDLRLNWKGVLDYIFISPGVQVLDSRLILTDPAPGQKRMYASDHFGIAATIKL